MTTDVCASTAETDRFLCKLCPDIIQLDVNLVSYFILPDRRTYRHDSASLATDTVQLYTSWKNIRIFTDENIFDWGNTKYEFRGRGKPTDLTSGIYYVGSPGSSPVVYRAKKTFLRGTPRRTRRVRKVKIHHV